MLNLKGCPRCGGDIYFANDIYGDYAECLQCGYMLDLDNQEVAAVGVKAPDDKEAA